MGLAALIGVDSFGIGFLVQSLLALWLYQRFQISETTAAAILQRGRRNPTGRFDRRRERPVEQRPDTPPARRNVRT